MTFPTQGVQFPLDGHPQLVGEGERWSRCGHSHHFLSNGAPGVDNDWETYGLPIKTLWLQVDDVNAPTEVLGQWISVDDSTGAAVWIAVGGGTALVPGVDVPGRTAISGDVANSALDTLADVTGLSFPVVAGTRYWFRFTIPYTSAATTTGSRWTINGPTTTYLLYRSEYPTNSTAITNNTNVSAYNTPAAANGTSPVNGIAIIEGFIQPSANGTVIARFASEVSGSAVTAKAGAVVMYQAQ